MGAEGGEGLTTTRTIPLGEYPVVLERVGGDVLPEMMAEIHREMHRVMRYRAAQRAPVKKTRGSRPAGAFRRAIGSVIGSSSTEISVASVAIAKIRPGVTESRVVNNAPHAIVIGAPADGYASPQAPEGVWPPAVRDVESALPGIIRRAIANAERKSP